MQSTKDTSTIAKHAVGAPVSRSLVPSLQLSQLGFIGIRYGTLSVDNRTLLCWLLMSIPSTSRTAKVCNLCVAAVATAIAKKLQTL